MNKTNNPKLKPYAQKLRKEMIKEERHLWYDFLKKLPITINRQKVIGNYIADFYCAGAKLIIELDGSQHYEEKGVQSDEKRTEYFNELGIRVLRYSNADIKYNFDGVCEDILKNINTSSVTS
ncbi:MAG: endonuclease domain-containing protein [Eubacterium sp.]|nr:endonuclease domain-containing protein [Eubacterium sp.]